MSTEVKELTKLEKLKADLEAKRKEKAEMILEKIEEQKIVIEMKRLDSPSYANRELAKQDLMTLTAILESFEDLGEKAKIRPVFGYGVQVDKILTIARSLHYAVKKEEIRTNMFEIAGLDEELIEELNDSLGNSAYYSEKTNSIVPEVTADVDRIRELLVLVGEELGLSKVNLTKVTKENIDMMRKRDLLNAQELMQNTNEHAEALQEEVEYEV